MRNKNQDLSENFNLIDQMLKIQVPFENLFFKKGFGRDNPEGLKGNLDQQGVKWLQLWDVRCPQPCH